jgi:CTP synthase (UTP-ammonia lyase)
VGFEPQDAIVCAVDDAASSLGCPTPEVRWFGTEMLDAEGPGVLVGASWVWCAPGSPFRSLTGALVGIRWARESGVPFLGTCAGFQHAVLEYARNVLGRERAWHAEYGPGDEGDLFIDGLLCSLVGTTMEVEIVDSHLLAVYGTAHPKERYYCRFGLNPAWREALEDAGLHVAGVDADDGGVRLMRLADHPFFVLTLFVPQCSSTPESPHPLVAGYLRAALDP